MTVLRVLLGVVVLAGAACGGEAADGSPFESAAKLARAIGCTTFEPEGRGGLANAAVEADRGRCSIEGGAEFHLFVADDSADADRIAKYVEKSECLLPPGDGGIPGLEPATLVRGENWVVHSGEDFSRENIDQIAQGADGRVIELCER